MNNDLYQRLENFFHGKTMATLFDKNSEEWELTDNTEKIQIVEELIDTGFLDASCSLYHEKNFDPEHDPERLNVIAYSLLELIKIIISNNKEKKIENTRLPFLTSIGAIGKLSIDKSKNIKLKDTIELWDWISYDCNKEDKLKLIKMFNEYGIIENEDYSDKLAELLHSDQRLEIINRIEQMRNNE